MWQFKEAVHGLADGSKELGIPVSGGNVSFYNQTGDEAILPTPVVGVLGVIDDVHQAIGAKLGTVEGVEELYLLGRPVMSSVVPSGSRSPVQGSPVCLRAWTWLMKKSLCDSSRSPVL